MWVKAETLNLVTSLEVLNNIDDSDHFLAKLALNLDNESSMGVVYDTLQEMYECLVSEISNTAKECGLRGGGEVLKYFFSFCFLFFKLNAWYLQNIVSKFQVD